MKLLILLLAVLALLWLLRGTRRRVDPPPARPGPNDAAEAIVACRHCGLHLPKGEALPGRGGVFCTEAHRAEYEKRHPAP